MANAYEIKAILEYLAAIRSNNNREWFTANRAWYDEVRSIFESMTTQLILRIGTFDETVLSQTAKSCTYRFNRDTRFSLDKSPYKTHLGAYINAKGKKANHGGYYFHLEPGNCLLAGGSYCLPTPVLRAVREAIVDEPEEYRSIVENPEFKRLYPVIGEDWLKKLPQGFPKDFPYPDYLRCKDYSCFHKVADDWLAADDWLDKAEAAFRILKPFLDFVNRAIDDFEE